MVYGEREEFSIECLNKQCIEWHVQGVNNKRFTVSFDKRIPEKRTYAVQHGRNECPTVGVPIRSCLNACDPVTSDVTGSRTLPCHLDCDIGTGDDERVAEILRRTRRTIDCTPAQAD